MSAADSLTELYNYRRISSEIATSGQPTETQFHLIAAQEIQVVINLGLADADYSLPDERGLAQSLGMTYEHIPVQWQNPTIDNFQDFLDCMRRHQAQKRLVHCAANMRVSCFMALYHVLEEQWTPEQAMADIQAVWSPNEVWQGFMAKVLAQGVE
jgi:protein tyrosine phosphatase (PTP) superfamily phosphohydrolase (DUF442 family)